ncbi:MAG: hypothetical protein C5B58_02345 [Acidobacteria bacterium]|nr:MAG: hypothetical protein C5B58_02345 [Acidobacteriota bacterium]
MGPRPAPHQAAYRPGGTPAGIVFIANGAGDYRTVTENLTQVVSEASLPLQLQTVCWSRGFRRYVLDEVDHDNHLVHGQELAVQIGDYRRAYPDRRIYLVGHSAGCAVLLAAAEMLPPDTLDRIILLSPSVCKSHDLRPSLRACRSGIDLFCSTSDRWILGLGVGVVGTTERGCRVAAGRDGFTPVINCPGDAALYEKLRQHPWEATALQWTGHDGGHFGNNQTAFLRAYVLPLCAP